MLKAVHHAHALAADEAWGRGRANVALYHRVVSVYAGHIIVTDRPDPRGGIEVNVDVEATLSERLARFPVQRGDRPHADTFVPLSEKGQRTVTLAQGDRSKVVTIQLDPADGIHEWTVPNTLTVTIAEATAGRYTIATAGGTPGAKATLAIVDDDDVEVGIRELRAPSAQTSRADYINATEGETVEVLVGVKDLRTCETPVGYRVTFEVVSQEPAPWTQGEVAVDGTCSGAAAVARYTGPEDTDDSRQARRMTIRVKSVTPNTKGEGRVRAAVDSATMAFQDNDGAAQALRPGEDRVEALGTTATPIMILDNDRSVGGSNAGLYVGTVANPPHGTVTEVKTGSPQRTTSGHLHRRRGIQRTRQLPLHADRRHAHRARHGAGARAPRRLAGMGGDVVEHRGAHRRRERGDDHGAQHQRELEPDRPGSAHRMDRRIREQRDQGGPARVRIGADGVTARDNYLNALRPHGWTYHGGFEKTGIEIAAADDNDALDEQVTLRIESDVGPVKGGARTIVIDDDDTDNATGFDPVAPT